MIYSIGGLIFNSVQGSGFDNYSATFKGEYTEQKIVDGAMSVRTGAGLHKLSFNAQWLGLEATAVIDDLKVLLTGIHQVSNQHGHNLGKWTCDSYTDNGSSVFGGEMICHNITLSLTEYR